VRIAAFYDTLL